MASLKSQHWQWANSILAAPRSFKNYLEMNYFDPNSRYYFDPFEYWRLIKTIKTEDDKFIHQNNSKNS